MHLWNLHASSSWIKVLPTPKPSHGSNTPCVVGACRVKSTYIENRVNKSNVALAELIGSTAVFLTCSLMELNSGGGQIEGDGWEVLALVHSCDTMTENAFLAHQLISK